jgi:hypothetical protein
MRAASTFVLVLLLGVPNANADARAAAPPPRALSAEIEVAHGDVSVRFSFPVRVPLWYLWQRATDCRTFVRHIAEIKECKVLPGGGKPGVLLQGEILGRPYEVAVSLDRHFRRGRGKLAFETRNVVPRQARGELRIERDADGQTRVAAHAVVPKDPEIPDLVVKLGLQAAIHGWAAQVQRELEADWRAFRPSRIPADIDLARPRSP